MTTEGVTPAQRRQDRSIFYQLLGRGGRGVLDEIVRLYGPLEDTLRWSDEGKIALVLLFVSLAMDIGITRAEVEDAVYDGPNPGLTRAWARLR